ARDWILANCYIIAGAILIAAPAFRYVVSTTGGRMIRVRMKLMFPIPVRIQQMVVFSRVCRVASLLLRSGTAMIQSLQILERLMDKVVVQRALAGARLGVERGQGLSEPLGEYKVFPIMLVQMVAVGEETGSLETVLIQLADYYDR